MKRECPALERKGGKERVWGAVDVVTAERGIGWLGTKSPPDGSPGGGGTGGGIAGVVAYWMSPPH
jgi:hypothetical protein